MTDYIDQTLQEFHDDLIANGFSPLQNCCFALAVKLDERWHEINGGTSSVRAWLESMEAYDDVHQVPKKFNAVSPQSYRTTENYGYTEVDGTAPQKGDLAICDLGQLTYCIAVYNGTEYVTCDDDGIVPPPNRTLDYIQVYYRKTS